VIFAWGGNAQCQFGNGSCIGTTWRTNIVDTTTNAAGKLWEDVCSGTFSNAVIGLTTDGEIYGWGTTTTGAVRFFVLHSMVRVARLLLFFF